ncbi:C-signal-like [Ammospiza nelsoni]|uniref:C-signal-like n=1 Tax=Ammospiza caudacuta TaxID=2857398 RepID=UPI0027385F39|nr:C-signal-like [Ammospiza caudacuta]XP_059337541.1 C-signal-like [Ammospiza nelsoni]
MAAARTVLLTGSNRGIGLELVKQLLGSPRSPAWIFATCRDPDGPRAQELRDLASKHSNLVLIKLDVENPSAITDAAKVVEGKLNGMGLNLLINNAGIYTPTASLDTVDAEDMVRTYKTNAVGPMLMAQAFLPLLKKAAQDSKEKGLSCSKAAIINISTILGSIKKTPDSFFHPVISYRCSKAALNMLTMCQALTYKEAGILCVALHPGWVKTDMGTQEADLTVDTSVRGLLSVLPILSEKHSGTLLNWEGKAIPW